MQKVLVATQNKGKFIFISEILKDLPIQLLSPSEIGLSLLIDEPFNSLEENAISKAESYAQASGLWTVADDTGIFFDILKGEPGVRTRRWSGYEASDTEIILHALKSLKPYPPKEWTCYFESVAVLKIPRQRAEVFAGKLQGIMLDKPRGENIIGLPFMSYFFVPEEGKTAAELPLVRLKQIGHRGIAFRKLKKRLQGLLR